MLSVGQLITELQERDREAIVKIRGEGDIVEIETTDDGNVVIEGDYDGIG